MSSFFPAIEKKIVDTDAYVTPELFLTEDQREDYKDNLKPQLAYNYTRNLIQQRISLHEHELSELQRKAKRLKMSFKRFIDEKRAWDLAKPRIPFPKRCPGRRLDLDESAAVTRLQLLIGNAQEEYEVPNCSKDAVPWVLYLRENKMELPEVLSIYITRLPKHEDSYVTFKLGHSSLAGPFVASFTLRFIYHVWGKQCLHRVFQKLLIEKRKLNQNKRVPF